MHPRVIDVEPKPNYKLLVTFNNGEKKSFDVLPYLGVGLFKELNDVSLFNSVKPFLGSVQWANGLDLCPDTLYLEGE